MSWWGRGQDALHDLLFGYEHGMTGERTPGIVTQLAPEQTETGVVEQILQAVTVAMGYPYAPSRCRGCGALWSLAAHKHGETKCCPDCDHAEAER